MVSGRYDPQSFIGADMATRDELYAKFGITAEAVQLFETELG